MKYIIKAITTMKPHNAGRYWIERGIIPEIQITAESTRAALDKWREIVNEQTPVTVSKTAVKAPRGMYIDTPDGGAKQIGYVITGRASFDDSYRGGKYLLQYVDIWTEIITTVETVFEGEAA